MDEAYITQTLNKQTQLLEQILERLKRLEQKPSETSIQQPVYSDPLNQSPALAHLNSLGISW
jgi:hypothetical protein